ncbi:hypothetical protein WICPIJ_004826 [Wickerhamomyces pijperi]|uniref:Uncharacterized protein n=1 Tax=Wickerhamomyces pijperi TaxID=599730 RepID=A0A9P8TLN8_WICPI|nr:hypothetical protein WICPIJ_004826 [Wickerhamomyces pijperi]
MNLPRVTYEDSKTTKMVNNHTVNNLKPMALAVKNQPTSYPKADARRGRTRDGVKIIGAKMDSAVKRDSFKEFNSSACSFLRSTTSGKSSGESSSSSMESFLRFLRPLDLSSIDVDIASSDEVCLFENG